MAETTPGLRQALLSQVPSLSRVQTFASPPSCETAANEEARLGSRILFARYPYTPEDAGARTTAEEEHRRRGRRVATAWR